MWLKETNPEFVAQTLIPEAEPLGSRKRLSQSPGLCLFQSKGKIQLSLQRSLKDSRDGYLEVQECSLAKGRGHTGARSDSQTKLRGCEPFRMEVLYEEGTGHRLVLSPGSEWDSWGRMPEYGGLKRNLNSAC